MTKKILILTAILGTILTVRGYAQGSTQAVMRVSAHVVEAVHIEGQFVNRIAITETNQNDFEIGRIKMTDIEQGSVIVKIPQKLKIRALDGNTLDLRLSSVPNLERNNVDSYVFKGSLIDSLPANGSYKGTLITTIEYM